MDTEFRHTRDKLVGVLMKHFRKRRAPGGEKARLSQEGLPDFMGLVDPFS